METPKRLLNKEIPTFKSWALYRRFEFVTLDKLLGSFQVVNDVLFTVGGCGKRASRRAKLHISST